MPKEIRRVGHKKARIKLIGLTDKQQFNYVSAPPVPSRADLKSDASTAVASPSAETSLRTGLTWTLAYTLVSYFTGAYFMADTVDFASEVSRHGLVPSSTLWEFGHLLWRPLGWVLLHTLGLLIRDFTGANLRLEAMHLFIALSWIAGLACVLLLRALLLRLSIRPAIANFSSLALLFSNAFLNYIHSGTSYIPGLAFLLLGFYLLAMPWESEVPTLRAIWPAGALAIAVCLWFPYVFAVPGILATPLFQRGHDRSRRALAVRATLYCLALGLLSYGSVLALLGISTMDGIYRWVTAEATAIGGVAGLNRVVFGLARSFIHMGADGVLFKRFLLHDPYNPVSALDLLRVSLFKLILFYGLLVMVVKQLLHAAHRPIFWLCTIVATPVLVFALFWYGGDTERYLPLYPAFFLALAWSLGPARKPQARSYLQWMAASFLVVSIVSNLGATSKLVLREQQRQTEERINDMLPLWQPGSRVIPVDNHDELVNFERSFPFDPIVRGGMLRINPLLNKGTPQTAHWRQDFAAGVLTSWAVHGEIWISTRLLEPHPHREWIWVEGDDPHVTWSMMHAYFRQLDYGRLVGGQDGFLLLLPTDKNKAILTATEAGQQSL